MAIFPVVVQRVSALRWFLVALVVLHGVGAWMMPADARVDVLLDGGRQVLVLLTLLTAVTLVLEPLNLGQRIAALEGLLMPLRPVGVDAERIGRLMALSLQDAFQLRRQLIGEVEPAEAGIDADVQGRVSRIVDVVARHCLDIEARTAGVSTRER